MSAWLFDTAAMTPRSYWLRAAVFSVLAWLYWESMNAFQFHWWAIDGLPTYVAGKLWLAGQTDAIYQSQLWVHDGASHAWEAMLWKQHIPNVGTTFVYHPLYLFLTLPFIALLSVNQFIVLLLSVNALSVGLLVMEIFRLAGGGDERRKLAAALVCISFPGLYAAFLGQNVLPTLLFLLLGWRLLGTGRLVFGGVLLTLAVAMKIWVLPVALLALAMHGRRSLFVGLCCMSGGLVLIPLMVDSVLLAAYFDIASRLTGITVYPYNNVSLRGGLARFDNPGWIAEAFTWAPKSVPFWIRLVEAMLISAVLVIAGALWRRRRPSVDFTFAGALSLILLIPGVCWTHYMVFVLPAAVLLWLRTSGWRSWVGLAALMFLVVPWHPIPRGVIPRVPFREFVEARPELLAWGLFLPMLLVTIVGFSVLSVRRSGSDASMECAQ